MQIQFKAGNSELTDLFYGFQSILGQSHVIRSSLWALAVHEMFKLYNAAVNSANFFCKSYHHSEYKSSLRNIRL